MGVLERPGDFRGRAYSFRFEGNARDGTVKDESVHEVRACWDRSGSVAGRKVESRSSEGRSERVRSRSERRRGMGVGWRGGGRYPSVLERR